MIRHITHVIRHIDDRRWNTIVLLLVALFLAWASGTGRIRRYLAPRYVWLTPVGAAFVFAMGAVGLAHAGNRHAHDHDHHGHACSCGGHGGRAWLYRVCLIAPFVAAAIVDPSTMSGEGKRKRQMSSQFSGTDVALRSAVSWILGVAAQPSTPGEKAGSSESVLPKKPTVRDIFNAALQGDQTQIEGRFVSVIGQCEPREGAGSNRFDLMRMVVICCIADASAVAVEVAPLPGTGVEPGEWARVSGVIKFDSPYDPSLPVVHASMIEKIPEPDYPYL